MMKKARSNILTKEEFIQTIDKIQEALDFEQKVNELYWNAGYQSPEYPDLYSPLIKTLDRMFYADSERDVKNFISDIDYFCIELDFGRKYTPGCITYADGTEIDMSTADKLYDYLMEGYVNGKEK